MTVAVAGRVGVGVDQEDQPIFSQDIRGLDTMEEEGRPGYVAPDPWKQAGIKSEMQEEMRAMSKRFSITRALSLTT